MASAPIFDRTIQMIQDRLDLVSLNHKVISSNLANVTTPRYAARELSFQQALQNSLQERQLRLATSTSRHIAPEISQSDALDADLEQSGPVDMERELMKLANNSVEYQYMVTLLNKKFAMLRHVISEGGV
jgi:flagellar basal-body rod protein FlgB